MARLPTGAESLGLNARRRQTMTRERAAEGGGRRWARAGRRPRGGSWARGARCAQGRQGVAMPIRPTDRHAAGATRTTGPLCRRITDGRRGPSGRRRLVSARWLGRGIAASDRGYQKCRIHLGAVGTWGVASRKQEATWRQTLSATVSSDSAALSVAEVHVTFFIIFYCMWLGNNTALHVVAFHLVRVPPRPDFEDFSLAHFENRCIVAPLEATALMPLRQEPPSPLPQSPGQQSGRERFSLRASAHRR